MANSKLGSPLHTVSTLTPTSLDEDIWSFETEKLKFSAEYTECTEFCRIENEKRTKKLQEVLDFLVLCGYTPVNRSPFLIVKETKAVNELRYSIGRVDIHKTSMKKYVLPFLDFYLEVSKDTWKVVNLIRKVFPTVLPSTVTENIEWANKSGQDLVLIRIKL